MMLGSRLLLAVLWLLHWLPLPLQAALGSALGTLLHAVAGSRRAIALRNVELCFPEMSERDRRALVKTHFRWLARSILERGLLWYASGERLRRLIRVEGDVALAERSERPVMWLVPHFMGLDVAGAATQLFQTRHVASIYQEQSDAVMDAAIRRGRLRYDQGEVFPRSDSAKPLIRAIRKGWAFFNLPDMDFGERDAAFVPFFGVPAATAVGLSYIARSTGAAVVPCVARMLPEGGYVARFYPAWRDFPSGDEQADARRMMAFIEERVLEMPEQYHWLHKRFKTRPEGEPRFY